MKYQKEFEKAVDAIIKSESVSEPWLPEVGRLAYLFFLAGVQAVEPTSKSKELPALLKPKNIP
jgi:hypothetical protein